MSAELELIDAARTNDLPRVKALLEAGADVNATMQAPDRPIFSGPNPVFGSLLFAASLVLLAYLLWRLAAKVLRILRWTKVTGQVVRHRACSDPESTYETPIIAFLDRRGRRFECEPNFAASVRLHPVGSHMVVAHDPEDPAKADADPTWIRYYGLVLSLFLVTVFPLLFGYLLAFGPIHLERGGSAALAAATRQNHEEIARLLVRAGARPPRELFWERWFREDPSR
jgi:hypothetical protein